MKVRRHLYRAGSILGDVNAVSKGPEAVGRRLIRKSLWKTWSRIVRTLLG